MAEEKLQTILRPMTQTKEAQKMKGYVQHGRVSTYEHCIRVATLSYRLNRKLGLHADVTSLVRGAFLHDFYLYDWHDSTQHQKGHGFHHPALALRNAERCFSLNDIERNIIISHMWPLTLRSIPKCREAVIVCIVDKWCSTEETLFQR